MTLLLDGKKTKRARGTYTTSYLVSSTILYIAINIKPGVLECTTWHVMSTLDEHVEMFINCLKFSN
jgi:hypothetical protein